MFELEAENGVLRNLVERLRELSVRAQYILVALSFFIMAAFTFLSIPLEPRHIIVPNYHAVVALWLWFIAAGFDLVTCFPLLEIVTRIWRTRQDRALRIAAGIKIACLYMAGILSIVGIVCFLMSFDLPPLPCKVL